MAKLSRFTDAYATMTVAVYEPLALKWYSAWSIYIAAGTMASRVQRIKGTRIDKSLPTSLAINISRLRRAGAAIDPALRGPAVPAVTPGDLLGRPIAPGAVKAVKVDRFPDAVMLGAQVYPRGLLDMARPVGGTGAAVAGNPFLGSRTVPTYIGRQLGGVDPGFSLGQARNALFGRLTNALQAAAASGGKSLADELRKGLAVDGAAAAPVFDFWPATKIEEAVAPVGVMHLFRQLYFNGEEGVGPIEQAFTIAPLETLEVVYQNTRRQIREEAEETGLEIVRESEEEVKNSEEISDKVSSMMSRDMSMAVAAEAKGTFGVWEANVSGSADIAVSTQRAREESSRRLKEVTKRASERITKSITIKTRDLEGVETVNLTRRVIKNDSAVPVSYGLRRVLRRVRVKIQDLGPRLVWQVYVRQPGAGLARSRFVHFREAEATAVPGIPPGVPPRPAGGTDTGQTSAVASFDTGKGTWFVPVVVQTGADREIKSLSIDSITDLEGGGLFDDSPAPKNDTQWGQHWDEATHTFSVNVGIELGDTTSVSLTYSYTWDPPQAVLDAWEQQRAQAAAEATQDALNEQFEREKTLITERSRVLPRPAADLRREERYEVLGRLVSEVFGGNDGSCEPSPLEIEWFNRYFEVDSAFVYTHPAWWKPRFRPAAAGVEQPAYEITADAEPAPLGSSLGWLLQLDGDDRRNEFINSPWVRACLPVRPGREREALDWLARHVEGSFGYTPNQGPLAALLAAVDKTRGEEAQLGPNGPDYVTINSSVGAPSGPLKPQNVYPVIDEFQVSVPTDGFVYDTIEVAE